MSEDDQRQCPVCGTIQPATNQHCANPQCPWEFVAVLGASAVAQALLETRLAEARAEWRRRVGSATKPESRSAGEDKPRSLRVFDIGGSGVKTIRLPDLRELSELSTAKMIRHDAPDWAHFAEWAQAAGLLDADVIGISSAGLVAPDHTVKRCSATGWQDRHLVAELLASAPRSKVYLLNDAESHLLSHLDLYPSPQMSISLGTALGFAISDRNGQIVRALDGLNFEIGDMILPTRASNHRVWWALGSNGLKELQHDLGSDEGVVHFGHRVGAFLASVCSIFRPRVVVFSGGITETWWPRFHGGMLTEFNHQKPEWLEHVDFVKSPHGSRTALIGITKYVRENLKR